MTDLIRAPWTSEQVDALNRFQREGGMHPFTCGGDHTPASPVLVAWEDGWHCPEPYGEPCDYRQDWAHAFMADPSAWPKPFQGLRVKVTDRPAFEDLDVAPEPAQWREQRLIDAHKATIGELRRAEALLRRYREWLAEQHARAEAADRVGSVPAELRISPHSGIAAGLHTALLGLDRILEPPTQNAGPSVTECAEADARWWNGEKVGE